MDDDVTFRPVTVNGRELVFAPPNVVQIALLHRLSKVAGAASATLDLLDKQKVAKDDPRRGEATRSGLEATARVLDMFASLTAPDVNEWLVDQMITGKIDDTELMRILTEIMPADEPAEKAPAKSRARRA